MRGLRRSAAPEGGRLLHILLVWFGQVPADASRRDRVKEKIMEQKVKLSPRARK